MTNESILTVENLILKRGRATVLDIEKLDIQQGRSLALIGPNGAGKSTLLLALAGLLPMTSGKLSFDAQTIASRSAYAHLRQNAAVVFQEPLLLNDTVYKNIALGLKFRHLGRTEITIAVEEALSQFGIEHLAQRSARLLSGGEAKRVSLARAFAIKPKMILLDEAFNSLDPPSREAIIDDLQNILEKTKITAVLALHDREETLRLAQDVAVMSEGKIIQKANTADIFQKPVSEFVAEFVGTEAILEGEVKSLHDGIMDVDINGRNILAAGNYPPGAKVFCCLRPEHITVSNAASGKTSARNIFEGKVQKIIRQAYFYKLILDCGFVLSAYITLPSFEELGVCEGMTLSASFKATAVHVIKREA